MNDYEQQRARLREEAVVLQQLAEKAGFYNIVELLRKYIAVIDQDQFVITILGEFNRGKSTMLNALLGEDIIPVAVRPTTATINLIHYGNNPEVVVHQADGGQKVLPWSKDILKEYTSLRDFDPDSVRYIELSYPLEYLRNGTVVVDTPGVNDICQQRMDVTYGHIPFSDAVIFLFDATTPFRRTEKEFLEEQILHSSIPTLFFLVNHIDKVQAAQVSDVLHAIQSNLQQSFPGREFPVFAVSAKKALQAKLAANDAELLRSGFTVWEEQLQRFITGGERRLAKINKLTAQLVEIRSIFWEDIGMAEQQAAMSADEIRLAMNNLGSIGKKYGLRFQELLEYVNEQSQALRNRIHASLLKDRQEFEEGLFLEIDTAKMEDFTVFAERILPYRIRQRVKNWVERSQGQVEQQVNTIINHTLTSYYQSFGKRNLIMDLYGHSPADIVVKTATIQLEGGDKLERVQQGSMLTGIALLGGLAVMTGGLGLPVLGPALTGSFLGKLAGGYFGKRISGKQKQDLLQLLPEVVAGVYEESENQINKALFELIQAFQQTVECDFESVWREMEEDVQQQAEKQCASKGQIQKRTELLAECKVHLSAPCYALAAGRGE